MCCRKNICNFDIIVYDVYRLFEENKSDIKVELSEIESHTKCCNQVPMKLMHS